MYYVISGVCLSVVLDMTSYLFGHTVPLLMTHAHVHTLLMEEFTLLWHQEDVTHEFPN